LHDWASSQLRTKKNCHYYHRHCHYCCYSHYFHYDHYCHYCHYRYNCHNCIIGGSEGRFKLPFDTLKVTFHKPLGRTDQRTTRLLELLRAAKNLYYSLQLKLFLSLNFRYDSAAYVSSVSL
jgi:hypothetical protein